jgi:drug/metabolite transporter (DMT)-like permease
MRSRLSAPDIGRPGSSSDSRGEEVDEVPFMRRPAVYAIGVLSGLALGFNWPVMAAGVDLLPPLWLSAARLAGGGLVLGVAVAAAGKLRVPQRRDYGVMATITLLRLAVVTSFVLLALQFTPPGRSSVLVYSSVLWTAPLARWLLGEKVTPLRQAGVVAGIVGVVIIVSPWRFDWSNHDLMIGYAFLMTAALVQAFSAVHIRGHQWAVSPLSYMPWQLVGAGLAVAVAAILVEGSPANIEVSWEAAAILGYQALIASAFGFWGVLTVTRNLPAVSSQLILMVAPAAGVAASAVVLSEAPDLGLIVGMLLIFAGVMAGMLSGGEGAQRVPDTH